MAKEGIINVVAFVLITLVMLVGAIVTGGIILKILFVLLTILTLFVIYFFRDPERAKPDGDNLILSPADGTVIEIEEDNDNEFFEGKVKKISIFMSVFNVHVNRIPIDGAIEYFNYKRGKFYAAYKEDAPYENEQTVIIVKNDKVRILFKQIAGVLARRIVCYIRQGNKVKQGERFGLIKFGSRVDMILPADVEIKVKLKDKVKGGLTIIGTY